MTTENINYKTWKQFSESGLLWFVNRTLHIFGWAIIIDQVSGNAYPAKVPYKGFPEESERLGYERMSKFIKEEK